MQIFETLHCVRCILIKKCRCVKCRFSKHGIVSGSVLFLLDRLQGKNYRPCRCLSLLVRAVVSGTLWREQVYQQEALWRCLDAIWSADSASRLPSSRKAEEHLRGLQAWLGWVPGSGRVWLHPRLQRVDREKQFVFPEGRSDLPAPVHGREQQLCGAPRQVWFSATSAVTGGGAQVSHRFCHSLLQGHWPGLLWIILWLTTYVCSELFSFFLI